MPSDLSTNYICITGLYTASFRTFPSSSQKFPSGSGECTCIFISMFVFWLSFHTMAAKLRLTKVWMSPHFKLSRPQFIGIQSNSLTAHKSGDQEQLSTYNLYPICSILPWAAVTEGVQISCLYLIHIHTVCIFLRITKFVNFDSKPFAFLWYTPFENDSTFK